MGMCIKNDLGSSVERLSSSQGSKKIKNYFLELIVKEEFQGHVSMFREKYNIPKEGFPQEREHYQFKGFHLPPKEWIHSDEGSVFWRAFLEELHDICGKYKIPLNNSGILLEYVFFSKVDDLALSSLCKTQKVLDIINDKDIQDLKDYPIAIRVSPYANERVILDYIRVAFTNQIEPLQEQYRVKGIGLGIIREKNESVQKRNRFIYDLHEKGCTGLEIKDAVKNAGYEGYFGQPEIAKIVSSEKKRRKQV